MAAFGKLIDPTRRLGSLTGDRHGHVLMARCRQCNHMGAFPLAVALQKFGVQLPLGTLQQRLKCDSCQQKAVEVIEMALCEPGCHRQRG